MSKLTPWFPIETKPVHIGVYETKYHLFEDEWSHGFSYWNGEKWSNNSCGVKSVKKNWTEGAIQEKKWRGLLEKPE